MLKNRVFSELKIIIRKNNLLYFTLSFPSSTVLFYILCFCSAGVKKRLRNFETEAAHVKGKKMEKLAIGIDLGGTNLKGIIMNEQGEGNHLSRIPTEAKKGGHKVLENILTLIEKLIQKQGSKENIIGVGIGTPGFVDRDGTVIGGAENLPGWKGTNLYDPIKQRFGLPATAGNDVTVAALAESRFGAGKGVKNMVCLALGTGIGGGLVINDQLFKGSHGMAGELGLISVETDGLQCNCGQKGCVEQYASATGIVEAAIRICKELDVKHQTPFSHEVIHKPQALTSKIVYDYVKKNDPVACRVNEYVCEKLARAIGIMVNALSPDRIILGGGVMMAGQVIVDTVSRYVPHFCWPEIWKRCDIAIAQLEENAGVLGAAGLVFEDFTDRRILETRRNEE
jgi:glucokinase